MLFLRVARRGSLPMQRMQNISKFIRSRLSTVRNS
jgi:hypothetical protein